MRDEEKAAAIVRHYRSASLSERERAICDYAVRLTTSLPTIAADDLRPLREAGLGDDEILDVCQVAAYYNFVNRLASGLGVELEDHWQQRDDDPV